MKNLKDILAPLMVIAAGLVPLIGSQTHGPVERAVTLPEEDIRKMMGDASESDKGVAVSLWRKAADALADAIVFTASRGRIKPD